MIHLRAMSAVELFRSLFEQASAQGSRSTALAPLGWALATMTASTIGAVWANGSAWLVIGFFCVSLAMALLYGIAYVYFMRTAPDNLRSEKFTLSKMALEQSKQGDSIEGFAVPTESRVLPEPAGAINLEAD